MMNAEQIAKGIESLTAQLETYESYRDIDLADMRREAAAGSPSMNSVIYFANKVKGWEAEIETIEAKIRLCKQILGE